MRMLSPWLMLPYRWKPTMYATVGLYLWLRLGSFASSTETEWLLDSYDR